MQDLRLLGQTQHGVYNDDLEDVHPDILHKYYGTTSRHSMEHSHHFQAGHPNEEDDNSGNDIGVQIGKNQEEHVRHEPVPVPDTSSPFPGLEGAFREAMLLVATRDAPRGFGLYPDEYEEASYPSFEYLRTGRRRKELRVSLPNHVWRQKAERWAKALDLMTCMICTLDTV